MAKATVNTGGMLPTLETKRPSKEQVVAAIIDGVRKMRQWEREKPACYAFGCPAGVKMGRFPAYCVSCEAVRKQKRL